MSDRTVHEQGSRLVLSSCFNVLYYTKVNLILLVRVVGLLFMTYVTESKLQSAEKLLSGMDFDTYYSVKILLVLADIFGDVEKETTMTMEATMQDLHIKEVLCL